MDKLLFILILLLLPAVNKAQSILESGDIAFVAINSDGEIDDFSFVLLKNIESGTSINFTDNGWTAADEFNPIYTESHINWTSNSNLKAGKVVQIKTYNGNQPASSTDGNIIGDKMTVSVAGDQILAYQGDKTKPRFIAAISFNQNMNTEPKDNFDGDADTNSTTAMPPGLTRGLNAIHIYLPEKYLERDNSIFNCTLLSGEKDELLFAINDVNNWLFNDDVSFVQYPFPCEFNVDAPTNIKEPEKVKYKVFPNPASNFIHVIAESRHDSHITVINSAGVISDNFSYPANATEQTYNIHHLPVGIYFLKIRTDDKESTAKISVVR